MKYLLLLFPSLCFAGDWSKEDTLWQIGYTALLTADCVQTRWAASHPKAFEEGNPVMGLHPSKGQIDNACLAMAFANFGISYVLPIEYRRFWQFSSIVIEGTVVFHNASIGIKMEF